MIYSPTRHPLRVTSPYGTRVHPVTGQKSFHNGIDIAAQIGTPLYAPISGVVTMNSHPTGGMQLILTHPGGLRFGFAHLSRYADGLSQGDKVTAGQLIAYSGKSGRVTGPHIHMTTSVLADGHYEKFDPQVFVYS